MTLKTSVGIRIRDLAIDYGDEPVVRIPELDLDPGTYTLVTGPTGCGKSSLALALAGVLEEMTGARITGDIAVAGVALPGGDASARNSLVAAVWQSPQAQLFRSTVLDEVRVGLDFRLVPVEEGDRRAREALRLVGLDHLDELRDPLTLSGGEQQCLALASALVLGAPVLVLDEAASQLDRESSEQLSTIIAEARRGLGITVIAFDHRPDPHIEEAGRVIVLGSTGQIMVDGSPEEVYARHAAQCREIGIRVPTADAAAEPPTSSPPNAVPYLSVRSLTVRRPRRDRQDAPLLRDVSFDLPSGATALLIGPYGSGKSTLLNALAGIQPRLTGRIEPPARTRRKRGIGYAPQRGSELLFTRTVRDELRSVLPSARARDSSSDDALDSMLDRAGLLALADAHPQRLSGGQRQRLSALLATAGTPALVLLDEPTNAQDALGVAQILALIRHQAEERITLIATHEEELFAGTATHRIDTQAGAATEVREL